MDVEKRKLGRVSTVILHSECICFCFNIGVSVVASGDCFDELNEERIAGWGR